MKALWPVPSFRDLNKVVLGAVALVLIGAVVGSAFAVGTLGLFQHRYQMSGVFTDSGGLRSGAPVRVAGINVGSVLDVSPDFEAGQVIITWDVDSGVHVGPDTIAEIGTSTLLGGDFLRLTHTEGGDPLQSRPRTQRRIPVDHTRTPYTVINAVGDATKQLNAIDVGTVNKLVNEVTTSIRDTSATVPGLIDDLAAVGTAVNQRQDQLNSLVANSEKITDALASRNTQLGQLIDQARGLLDALTSRHDQLAQLLGSGSSAAAQAAALIDQKRAEIGAILDDLHQTLGAVDRQLPAVNTGLAYAGPTISALAAVVSPTQFNIAITGVGPASLANLNKVLNSLLGPSS